MHRWTSTPRSRRTEQRVSIFAVNPSRQLQKRTLDLTAMAARWRTRRACGRWPTPPGRAARREQFLARTGPHSRQPGKTAVADGKLVYEFPALSLTVLEAHRRGSGGP